jgi:hypothetical protein
LPTPEVIATTAGTWADWHGARIRSVADELVATLIEVYQMEPNGPLAVLTDS